MKKYFNKNGRKFSFAMFVLWFVIASITLHVFLLCFGKITPAIYEKLFIYCGGFITMLAGSYFYSNAKSKQYYNEDVNQLRKEMKEGNK